MTLNLVLHFKEKDLRTSIHNADHYAVTVNRFFSKTSDTSVTLTAITGCCT